jgi:hypothetical protein
MFSALFAGYAVLVHATAGGLKGMQLFNQQTVASKPPAFSCLPRTDVAGGQFATACRHVSGGSPDIRAAPRVRSSSASSPT